MKEKVCMQYGGLVYSRCTVGGTSYDTVEAASFG